MATPAILLKEKQLELSASIQDLYRTKAAEVRELIKQAIAANGISLTHLARVTGIDNSQITRILDGRANIPGELLAALFELDEQGVLICGLADMCGRDAIERRPDPVAENKLLRSQLTAMRDELDRLLGRKA